MSRKYILCNVQELRLNKSLLQYYLTLRKLTVCYKLQLGVPTYIIYRSIHTERMHIHHSPLNNSVIRKLIFGIRTNNYSSLNKRIKRRNRIEHAWCKLPRIVYIQYNRRLHKMYIFSRRVMRHSPQATVVIIVSTRARFE